MKQLVTLYCGQDDYASMLKSYRVMLNDMKFATRNECTEAIDILILLLSQDERVIEEAYEMSMTA